MYARSRSAWQVARVVARAWMQRQLAVETAPPKDLLVRFGWARTPPYGGGPERSMPWPSAHRHDKTACQIPSAMGLASHRRTWRSDTEYPRCPSRYSINFSAKP